MAELKDILQSQRAAGWERDAFRFQPVPSADAPNNSLFMNADLVAPRLCFKNNGGAVFKIRMGPL